MAEHLALRLTQAFASGGLDLSARPTAPTAGWEGMPEVASVVRLRAAGADPSAVRRFLTFIAALDYSRDSDRLWGKAAALYEAEPWVFQPAEVTKRSEQALEALRVSGVSQRHTRDGAAWLRIGYALRTDGIAPEVAKAVEAGIGDAPTLLSALGASGLDGRPLFPLLRGPKIGPMWVRMLAYPGEAEITNLAFLPVSVDVQVVRVTRFLGVADVHGLSEGEARRHIQRRWRDEVIKSGTAGPPKLGSSCAALDPALWFWGKWGCSVCEQAGRRIPIGEPCSACIFDSAPHGHGSAPVAHLSTDMHASYTSTRIDDVRKLVDEHLNAAMIMVRLDEPLDPDLAVSDVLAYLNENEFDLALLQGDDVRIVYRSTLAGVAESLQAEVVAQHSSSPRVDRLVEHTLELGEIARRLRKADVPLLVVGRNGPEHIITRADFTRPAGQAAALAVLAALDAVLDDLLQPYDSEVWLQVAADRQKVIESRAADAHRRGEEVARLSYLTFGERLGAIRSLNLGRRLSVFLGSEVDHSKLTKVRNDIAHGRIAHGAAVIEALDIAERVLDGLVLQAVQTKRGDPTS